MGGYIAAAACAYLLTAYFSTVLVVVACGLLVGFSLALFEITWNVLIDRSKSWSDASMA